MITHIVMLKLYPGVGPDEMENMYKQVLEAKSKIPEIQDVRRVTNIAIPRRTLGFDNGFLMVFADNSSLDIYYDHPAHKVLSNYLRGIADLLVLDYE